jgi:transmembrane sensor
MAQTGNIPPEVRAEAAAWLARLHADDRSAADEHAFRAWLAEDAVRRQAFEAVTAMWESAGALTAEPLAPRAPALSPSRRGALVFGAGTLVAAGATAIAWQSAYAGVYETEVGEQKHVVLADGTQAFLDTDTRIRADYDDELRKISLDRGRCDFHVMPTDARPFVVDAADQRIVADHTIFDVRRDGNRISVVCLQGAALVVGRQVNANRRSLSQGQRLVATPAAFHVDKPNLAPLVAWQTGQAMFDNETLADAVAEMNRYSSVKLRIDDPAVARMWISGVYRVGDNSAFARSVALLLPVDIQIQGNEVHFVADRSRLR